MTQQLLPLPSSPAAPPGSAWPSPAPSTTPAGSSSPTPATATACQAPSRARTVHGVPGDVADADHRAALVEIVTELGGLDLLVLNASTLGPLPMRPLTRVEPTELGEVFRTNAGAHGRADDRAGRRSCCRRDGVVIGISSDAAVQHYETWGAYGASKAALDHLVLTFGAETGLSTYAVDPGDMRTPMHQDAFPGEDISDRPLPGDVVPRLLALVEQRPPSAAATSPRTSPVAEVATA